MVTLSDLEISVLLTLAYSAQFDFPLTRSELWRRLVRVGDGALGKGVGEAALAKSVQMLVKKELVEVFGESVVLHSQRRLIPIRQHRQRTSQAKQLEAQHALQFIQKLPWIHSVWLTGSVAVDNAKTDDDLDFMIVTNHSRLWLCRVLIMLWAILLGKKRGQTGDGKYGWCFNLWLDEAHLSVLPAKQNIYQAYEVVQARLISNDKRASMSFYSKNSWIDQYLINFDAHNKNTSKSILRSMEPDGEEKNLLAKFILELLNYGNTAAYILQRWYMRARQTSERVGEGYAFFHPRDTERIIFEQWRARFCSAFPKSEQTNADRMFSNATRRLINHQTQTVARR